MDQIVKTAYMTGQTGKDVEKQIGAFNKAIAQTNKSYDYARRNIQAEARTSIATHAARAQEEIFAKNSDIFPWLEYMSVLDSRTTNICASLDGRTYKVDDPNRPSIPQHWNCRSVYVPKETKDEEILVQTRQKMRDCMVLFILE